MKKFWVNQKNTVEWRLANRTRKELKSHPSINKVEEDIFLLKVFKINKSVKVYEKNQPDWKVYQEALTDAKINWEVR